MENIEPMETNKKTFGKFIRSMRIMQTYFIIGQILFAFGAFSINGFELDLKPDKDMSQYFIIIIPLLVIAGTYGGSLLFQFFLIKANTKKQLLEKIELYKTALITRYAILEGVSLLSIVIYLITSDLVFLVFSGVLIILLAYYSPRRANFIANISLSEEEKEKVNQSHAILD